MSNMFGVDVSHWQMDNGFSTANVQADFVFVKATQGTTYKDRTMEGGLQGAMNSGKLVGVYHFADGKSSGAAEANWFISVVKPYVGKAMLVLDWEADALKKGPGYAKAFSDRVYQATGVKPVLYCSLSTINASWIDYARSYPYVWVAKYGSNPTINGYSNNIPSEGASVVPFKKEIIRQYSSKTHLAGYGGDLDANKAYITRDEWTAICKGKYTGGGGGSSSKTPTMSVTEVANKIIAGTDGWNVTGNARKAKLQAEGYNPTEVQNKINEILGAKSGPSMTVEECANKIIAGKDGWNVTGEARKAKIRSIGLDPDTVQKRINAILGAGKAKMTVDECAKKIIRGTDGWNVTGEARKAKIRSVGLDPATVQKRVNQLLK